MISSKKKILAFGAVTATLAAVAFGAVVFGGAVTVAATDPHHPGVQWILETTMESSIRAHAADIEVPANVDLQDPKLAERAYGHYSVACTPCHGAPGVDPAPWLVLNPPAGSLVETAALWSDAELYWIVENGIKMTGMPALGPTHGAEDLWAISAFVRQLPEMSPEEYRAMANRHAARQGLTMASTTATVVPPVAMPEPPPVDAPAPVTEKPSSPSSGPRATKQHRTPFRNSASRPAQDVPESSNSPAAAPRPPHDGHETTEPRPEHHHH